MLVSTSQSFNVAVSIARARRSHRRCLRLRLSTSRLSRVRLALRLALSGVRDNKKSTKSATSCWCSSGSRFSFSARSLFCIALLRSYCCRLLGVITACIKASERGPAFTAIANECGTRLFANSNPCALSNAADNELTDDFRLLTSDVTTTEFVPSFLNSSRFSRTMRSMLRNSVRLFS